MIVNRRNRPAHNPQDWSNKSAIARIDKVGGGKRQAEEQLAAVVLNTRRNQSRLERALETGNMVRAGTLAALVAKGMADAKRLAETLEESGRTTFAKAKEHKAMRPIIVWAKGEQEATVAETGKAILPTLPKATTTIGVTGDHKAKIGQRWDTRAELAEMGLAFKESEIGAKPVDPKEAEARPK